MDELRRLEAEYDNISRLYSFAAKERTQANQQLGKTVLKLNRLQSYRNMMKLAAWHQKHLSGDEMLNVALAFAIPSVLVPIVFAPVWYFFGSLSWAIVMYAAVLAFPMYFLAKVNATRFSDAATKLSELDKQIEIAQRDLKLSRDRRHSANVEFQRVQSKQTANLGQIAAVHERRRAVERDKADAILAVDWRSLRGIPFEDFLQSVLENRGWQVETTKASNDQGVDLIARRSGVSVAIQAKGYNGSVGNSAVQQAFTGKQFYSCNKCAVITNSEFTTAAKEAAKRTGCVMIDGSQIRDLATGSLAPFGRAGN